MYKILATAAVALCVATPVFAQSVPEKIGVNATLGISPSTQDFVTEAANSDMLEIESSKLVAAEGDARDKAFADQMIKNHTATSAELKALVISGKVAAELPAALDKAAGAKLDKLNSLSGADFTKTCSLPRTRTRCRCSSAMPRAETTPPCRHSPPRRCRTCASI